MWKPTFDDSLRYEGRHGHLENSIFENFLRDTDELSLWESMSPDKHHLYSATWLVHCERLFLLEATCLIDGFGVIDLLPSIFRKVKPPIFSEWFTGSVVVITNSESDSCISSIPTEKAQISIKEGKVTSFWEMKKRLLKAEQWQIDCRKAWLCEPIEAVVVSSERAGRSWSKEEDIRLTIEHQLGTKTKEIAAMHSRSGGAIRSRLKQLGLLNEMNCNQKV